MKIILCVFIIVVFGLTGKRYKDNLIKEYELLKYIQDFIRYYNSNIVLFKDDYVKIINNYIIMQNNKNAKNNQIFIKNNYLYVINENFINKNILNKEIKSILLQYLKTIASSEYEYEKEKNYNFDLYLNKTIFDIQNKIKTDGNLAFKLSLSIGCVLAIIIW